MSDKIKYGVPYLAKKLGIEAASVRVSLRNKKVPTNKDGVYAWPNAAAADAVAAKLRTPATKKTAKKSAVKKKAA